MKTKTSPLIVRELAYELRIEDAMACEVVIVAPDDAMYQVRQILKDRRISGMPVVSDNRMIGIVSIENLIECLLRQRINTKVKNNMVSEVKFIYNDEPLVHAISKFEKLGYGRFPVLDHATGKLVGIITKGDVIKCLLRKLEEGYYQEKVPECTASRVFEEISSDRTTITLRHKINGGDFKSAGEQSGHLKASLLKLGIPPEVARRIVIAACEAEMNVVIFTEGGELVTSVEKEKIKVNAIDKGPGIPDVEKAMQPGFSTAPDWVRELGFGAGMGLPNIKECSDEMRIDSKVGEGTNLEFVVNLS